MMKRIVIIQLLLVFAGLWWCRAQELPPVNVYTPNEYNADNQNWSITQANNGHIFTANNKGLLHFNGASWQLYPSPNKTILRAVKAVGDSVYTGAYMNFGVWSKNKNQQYEYRSLSDSLELLEDEHFWNIIALNDHSIAFQSLNRIYFFNPQTKTFQQIDAEFGINKMFLVDHILYYQKINEGIFKIINGEEVLVSKHPVFLENLVVNIYTIDNRLYAQTQNKGIVALADATPYRPKNRLDLWENISVYNSCQASNGDIYIGTISHGLLKLSDDNISYELNQENGLSNNTVLAVFEDRNQNIWLGLDNGINCVNSNAAIRVFHDDKGVLGTVYTAVNHNGNIYLGTNQGLFAYDPEQEAYQFIKNTKGQVWSLFVADDTLFCGHNNGTFIIEEAGAKRISDVQGTWSFKKWNDKIIQGNYNGLHVLEKQDGNWQYAYKIKGFDISTKYFEFVDDRQIVVNHEYKGIYKLTLNADFTKVIDVKKDFSVPKGLYSSIINYRGKILYAFKRGMYVYDAEQSKFVKDSLLSQLYANREYTSGRLVKTDDGSVWAFTKTDLIRLLPSSVKGKHQINKIPIPHEIRSQVTGYENVSLTNPGEYLFGNTNGYFKVSINQFEKPEVNLGIERVEVKSKENIKNVYQADARPKIPFKHNYLDIYFASVNYKGFFKTEYQYKLVGYDQQWSDWSTTTQANYKNLNHGEYTFQVRARVGSDHVSPTKTFSFVIEKPFYLSTLMLVVYGLVFIGFGFLVHLVYKQYYKRQREKLQQRAERELKIQEGEAQQEIMRINNEKLKQDIDNKNRELAISTMSLIKKNEFLAGIKADLSDVKVKNPKLTKAIKAINRNLNNTDDWKFFEEAFNNADKDFLKKIKAKHPSLTPNDLRLCAYLRLNLSSKEIAPLFNISTRSVEVKRYRLRKKMDLSREESLTNYILEI